MSESGDSRTKPSPDSADTSPVDNSLLELSRELGLLAGRWLSVLEKTEMSNDPRESAQ